MNLLQDITKFYNPTGVFFGNENPKIASRGMLKVAVKIMQNIDQKHNKLITQMKKLSFKYFQHINRIIKIMQPHLTQNQQQSHYMPKISSGSQYSAQQQLEHEFQELKLNIQNLLRYCHNIEIENKKLKNSHFSQIQILQQNNYVIGQDDFSMAKSQIFTSKGLAFWSDKNCKNSHLESQELRKTRQLYLESLHKIQELKNEISQLNELLNLANQKISRLSSMDSSSENQKYQTSASKTVECEHFSDFFNADLSIQNLYCHENLDLCNSSFKENSSVHFNRDQSMVESLIAKGIQFRQQRTLRSHEFKHLNTIVEKYRQQSMSHSSQFFTKKVKNSLYR